jgi:hypothetical protein
MTFPWSGRSNSAEARVLSLSYWGGPRVEAFTPQPSTGKGWFGLAVEPGVLAGVVSGIYKIVTTWSPSQLALHRGN